MRNGESAKAYLLTKLEGLWLTHAGSKLCMAYVFVTNSWVYRVSYLSNVLISY